MEVVLLAHSISMVERGVLMARKEAWRPSRRPRFLSVSMRGDDRLLRSGVVTVSWLGCGEEHVTTPQRKGALLYQS